MNFRKNSNDALIRGPMGSIGAPVNLGGNKVVNNVFIIAKGAVMVSSSALMGSRAAQGWIKK